MLILATATFLCVAFFLLAVQDIIWIPELPSVVPFSPDWELLFLLSGQQAGRETAGMLRPRETSPPPDCLNSWGVAGTDPAAQVTDSSVNNVPTARDGVFRPFELAKWVGQKRRRLDFSENPRKIGSELASFSTGIVQPATRRPPSAGSTFGRCRSAGGFLILSTFEHA